LIARAAWKWGDKVGLIFDEYGEQLTYGDIDRRSNEMAGALQEVGVEPGDRVGIMLRNTPEFPLTWLGLQKLGATTVPVNINYGTHDAQYILDHSETKAVVTSSEFIPLLQRVRPSIGALEHVLSVDGADVEGVRDVRKVISESSVPDQKEFAALPERLANIQYTSGTTGSPKGCMLTQQYWVTIARRFVQQPPRLSEDDVMLTAQPFHYMDPQWNVAASLASGAPLVVLDRFHPSTFWRKVREHSVTFFYCLGIMPRLMLKMPPNPADQDNRVRHVSCSAIPINLHEELEQRFGAPWHELFGMTETGVNLTVGPEDHNGLVGTGCIGRPMDGCEIRILDEDDQPVPRGDTGELALRGTGIMDGYYKNREATDTAFKNGWFHTRDIACMDEHGLVYYLGRNKEMIRRSGENISSGEVEEVVGLHPAVELAACIPVPDELREEEIKAYVVLKGGERKDSVTPQELADFCSERLAYFKVPRYWEYRGDLPRTPSEKIAKHTLRDEKPDLATNSYDRDDGIWR
jgi:crotonobetaine/carnitine-CoA ligase